MCEKYIVKMQNGSLGIFISDGKITVNKPRISSVFYFVPVGTANVNEIKLKPATLEMGLVETVDTGAPPAQT